MSTKLRCLSQRKLFCFFLLWMTSLKPLYQVIRFGYRIIPGMCTVWLRLQVGFGRYTLRGPLDNFWFDHSFKNNSLTFTYKELPHQHRYKLQVGLYASNRFQLKMVKVRDCDVEKCFRIWKQRRMRNEKKVSRINRKGKRLLLFSKSFFRHLNRSGSKNLASLSIV